MDNELKAMICAAILLVGGLGVALYYAGEAAEQDRIEWEAFKQAHECKRIGHRDSTTTVDPGYAISASDGSLHTTFTTRTNPAMDGWACNDGVTYWKRAR